MRTTLPSPRPISVSKKDLIPPLFKSSLDTEKYLQGLSEKLSILTSHGEECFFLVKTGISLGANSSLLSTALTLHSAIKKDSAILVKDKLLAKPSQAITELLVVLNRILFNVTALHRIALKAAETVSRGRGLPPSTNSVINSLYRESVENTDTTNIGNTRIRDTIQANQNLEDVTRTNNISGLPNSSPQNDGGLNTSMDGRNESDMTGSSQKITDGETGANGYFSGGGGGAIGPSDEQKHGRSLRAPMSSGGNPERNGPSKNIFFKFKGDSSTPGVWLHTNPQQLSINMSKRLPEQVTRGGFVIFHWGDNLDEISASGWTGSFCRVQCPQSDTGAGYTGSQPDFGLDRRDTWPYRRFMELLAIYRNNGIRIVKIDGRPIQTGGLPADQRVLASARGTQTSSQSQNQTFERNTGSAVDNGLVAGARHERPAFVPIELHYDDQVFTGYFNAFTWTERADQPFVFTFDFKFTVLTTEYNRVYQAIGPSPSVVKVSEGLLANFQFPRYNAL